MRPISGGCVPYGTGVFHFRRVCPISGVYVPFQLVCPISGGCVPFRAGVSHFRWVCLISGGCVPYWTNVFHIGRVCPISGGLSQFRRVCIISGGCVSYWTGVSHFRRVSLDFDRFIRLWAVFCFQTVRRRECGWNFKTNFRTFLRQNELKV